jgi:NAD(P)-dependent dehydrogenase (short-subunit alcohol dehydrogenase family)
VDITLQEVQDCFDTNVIAAFNLTQIYLAAPTPVSGHKTIIHISSAAGQMRSPFRVGYGPSKAAVTQMMQHVACEQEGDDVRVFSLHPRTFYTPAAAEIYAENAFDWEDINLPAHFALWLAGPESGFLHGRYVWAHWDVDELIGLKDKFSHNRPGGVDSRRTLKIVSVFMSKERCLV